MFEKSYCTKENWIQSFEYVITRLFGWFLPDNMMIPFADFLNHNRTAGTAHYLYNKKLETLPKEILESKYKPKAEYCDFAICYDDKKEDEAIQKKNDPKSNFFQKNLFQFIEANKVSLVLLKS